MNLVVTKIVRRGKFRTRVETSDGKQLVLDHDVGVPFVGQDLGISLVEAFTGELRPVRKGDSFPEIISDLQD